MVKNTYLMLMNLIVVLIAAWVLSGYTTFNDFYIQTQTNISNNNEFATPLAKQINQARALNTVPTQLNFELSHGSLELGEKDLYAYDADEKHIKFIRDQNGLFIQNISSASKVPISLNGEKHYPREYNLSMGDKIFLAGNEITITKLTENKVEFSVSSPQQQVEYVIENGKVVQYKKHLRAKNKVESCLDFPQKIKKIVKSASAKITIGGNLVCHEKIPLPGVSKNSFVLSHHNGILNFKAANGSYTQKYRVAIQSAKGVSFLLKDNKLPLPNKNGATSNTIKLGYSKYSFQYTEQTLSFTPVSQVIKQNQALIQGESKALKNNGITLGTSSFALVILLIVLVKKYEINNVNINNDNSKITVIKSLLIPALVAVFAIYFHRLVYSDPSATAVLCFLVMTSLILCFSIKYHWITSIILAFFILCLLVGIDYGLSLNLSPLKEVNGELNWSTMNKYFNDFAKQLFKITIMLELWLALAVLKFTHFAVIENIKAWITEKYQAHFWKYFLAFWAAMLLLQFFAGSETGIAGIFQPNEFIKLLFCFFVCGEIYAHSKLTHKNLKFYIQNDQTARWRDIWEEFKSEDGGEGRFWLFNGRTAFLYYSIVCICGLVFLVHDFSYIFIIAAAIVPIILTTIFWTISESLMLNRHKLAIYLTNIFGRLINCYRANQQLSTSLQSLFILIVFISCFLFLLSTMLQNKDILSGLGIEGYLYRIEAWLTPYASHESGWQVSQAFSLRNNDNAAMLLYKVPEIDDDFAITGWFSSFTQLPKFLLFTGSLGLMFFSIMSVQLIKAKLNNVTENTNAEEDEELKKSYRYIGIVYAGLFLLLAHILLSIATNFNLLPVMGQPYPMLGRQGSFMMLFIIPFFIFLSLQYPNNEEL